MADSAKAIKAARMALTEDMATFSAEMQKHKEHLFYLNANLKSNRKRKPGWSYPGTPERDMSSSDRNKAMARARQKVEESPLACAMAQTLTDHVIGQGFRLSMRAKHADAAVALKWNREIEARWARAKNKIDIRGVRGWGQLQRMWYTRRMIDGDVGVWKIPGADKNDDGTQSTYVQTIEAERISGNTNKPGDVGVEYDKFGRPVRYQITGRRQNKDGTIDMRQAVKTVDATKFVLYAHYPQERAERQRGVSMFVQNLNLIQDLEEIIDGMNLKVKKEAFMGLKFEMAAAPDGSFLGADAEVTRTDADGKAKKHIRMVPGLNVRTDPGEAVDVIESKSPNSDFTPYLKFLLRYGLSRIGLPLEMVLLDFTGINYSGGRGLTELAKKRFGVEQDSADFLADNIFEFWLAREIKHTAIEMPDGLAGPWSHRWGHPGLPYLDPMKEIQAAGLAIAYGLGSRRQFLEHVGSADFEDVAQELSDEMTILNELNVPIILGQPGSNAINEGATSDPDTPMTE